MLTLPAFLACSFFCLLTLEIFSEVILLQLGCGIARLTKAGPVSLPCAPLTILNLLQVDSLLLHLGTARAGGLESRVRQGSRMGRAVGSQPHSSKERRAGHIHWQSPGSNAA